MAIDGKRVLVTGAGGFIGSHLTEALLHAGAKVRAFVFYNPLSAHGCLDDLPDAAVKEIELFPGDVRDGQRIREAMGGVDIVFHLAALVGIPYSYHAPESYVDTNIRGTLNVLQAARELGTPRLLVTSTSEVYGTALRVPIDEEHPLQAQSPYSATKIAADRLAESFHRSFDLPVTIVRPFNAYGPRQSARAVIPTIITQLLSGAEEIRLGDLSTSRDFNFCRDIAAGFISIARSPQTIGEEINIATGSEITIGDLAAEAIRQINPQATVVCDPARIRPSRSEVRRLLGCNRKLRQLTDWEPQTTFADGLSQTIAWFGRSRNLDRYNPDIYTI